jgi:hypothetical protein
MFKLNIECTKDIHELHINFADGTSVVTSNSNHSVASTPRVPREQKQEKQTKVRSEKTLDTDVDFGNVSQEVVVPPDIQMQERPVKVAAELQNLDF